MLSTVKSFHVHDMADQRPGAGTVVLSAADQDQLLSKIHKLNSHLKSMDEENISEDSNCDFDNLKLDVVMTGDKSDRLKDDREFKKSRLQKAIVDSEKIQADDHLQQHRRSKMTSRSRRGKNYLHTVLILLSLVLYVVPAAGQCQGPISDGEYQALYSLFNATNGTHWDWLGGTSGHWVFNMTAIDHPQQEKTGDAYLSDPCSEPFWQGLTCGYLSGSKCYIYAINLADYNLQGQLPVGLGNLSQLQSLYLNSNSIRGSIPSSLGNLAKLGYIDLDTNILTGPIPSSLGNLVQLQYLALYNNFLTYSIPSSLGNVTVLHTLSLYNNSLTGPIPSSLGNITLLSQLFLYYNSLTGSIPSSLGNLAQLTQLQLSYNSLTGPIPSSLGNLTLLSTLALFINSLTGRIPSSLGTLSQLGTLEISSNALTGPIPSSLGNLTLLKSLEVNTNSLTGPIPSSLGKLVRLETLTLYSNSLTGLIPSSLGNLGQLQIFEPFTNLLTGTIPSSLGNLAMLQEFVLFSSFLTGSIPSSLGNLTRLEILELVANLLTGPIPSSLGNLEQLGILELNTNSLSGSIPSSLGAIAQLEILALGTNLLTGSIPSSLVNLTLLEILEVDANSLTGSVPSSLGNLTSLESLYLYSNSLTGPIPSALGNLTALTQMYMDSNCLTGSIPKSLGRSAVLSHLDLASNFISGPLPVFSACVSLTDLYLGFNYLTGPISYGTWNFPNGLSVLALEENRLSGTLPSNLSAAVALTQLLLDSNSFSGSLPASIAHLQSLQVLIIEQNQFTGRPDVAFNTSLQTQLSTVDLSFNLFTGTIPSAVFGLPALKSFAAIQSCFHGSIPGAAICGSPYLEYLLLDGVTSGESCRNHIGVSALNGGTSVAYIPKNGFIVGGIPSCIWAMSTLSLLHLSSNGLTGTIASNIAFQNGSDINLSHNQLTGTIPLALQSTSFASLDLSYNRLKGGFTESINPSVQLISLSNNRLSGYVPSSFAAVTGLVSVMQGNLFNCNPEHSAPPNDAYTNQTFCGSEQFNYSIIFSGVVFVMFVLLAAAVFCCYFWIKDGATRAADNSCRGIEGDRIVAAAHEQTHRMFKRDLQDLLSRYCATFTHCLSRSIWQSNFSGVHVDTSVRKTSLSRFISILNNGLFLIITAGSAMVVLCLCVYPALSVSYSTHTEQYLWVVTSAFLEGTVAAGVVLALYFLGLVSLSILLIRVPSQESTLDTIGGKFSTVQNTPSTMRWHQKLRSWIGDFIFIVFLLGVLMLANVGYLYAVLFSHQSRAAQILVQLALAVFKAFCNTIAIPFDPVGHKDSKKSSLLWRKFAFYAFNNVLAPCLISLVADSQCLFDLFVSTADIVENFDYSLASEQACVNISQFNNIIPTKSDDDLFPAPAPSPTLHLNKCYSYSSPVALVSTYYPPFTYSYQCGASIITNYVPMLIYSYTLQAVLSPLLFGFLRLHFLAEDRAGIGEEHGLVGRMLNYVGLKLEGILRPLSTGKTGRRLLATGSHTAFVMQIFLVMLTFGLASLLLALVLIITFATNVATTMVGIDLYLEVSPRCRQLSPTEDPEAGSTGIISEKGIHSDDQTPMHLQPTPDPNNGASTTIAALQKVTPSPYRKSPQLPRPYRRTPPVA